MNHRSRSNGGYCREDVSGFEERRPQPLRHHSQAFWFVAISAATSVNGHRRQHERDGNGPADPADGNTPPSRIGHEYAGRLPRLADCALLHLPRTSFGGRSRSLAWVSTRRSARRCVATVALPARLFFLASAPIRSASHSTLIACEHHGANRLGHARSERSTARATCSRERARTAHVSATRQRSGLPAEHSSPRSASTVA